MVTTRHHGDEFGVTFPSPFSPRHVFAWLIVVALVAFALRAQGCAQQSRQKITPGDSSVYRGKVTIRKAAPQTRVFVVQPAPVAPEKPHAPAPTCPAVPAGPVPDPDHKPAGARVPVGGERPAPDIIHGGTARPANP